MEVSVKLVIWLLCLLIVELAPCRTAHAFEEIKLLAYDIPSILQSDKKGEYDKLISKAAALENTSWHYNVAPPSRVDKMFEEKLVDCIIPYDKVFHINKNTVNTTALGVATASIFSVEKKYASLSELAHLKVGARIGMLYGAEFDKSNLTVEYVARIEQNINKLLSNRINAFVAWSPDVDAVLKTKNIKLQRSNPFVVHNDAFLCHNTDKARKFIKLFNSGMIKAKALSQ